MSKTFPKIGTAIFIVKDGKILIGRRKTSSGYNTWGLPGGHLEFGEQLIECIERETKEEANIEIQNIQQIGSQEDVSTEKHYITFFFSADYKSGVAKPLDGEFHEWKWLHINDFPENLFPILQKFIKENIHKIKNTL